jgi:hypothetical protein
VLCASGSGRRRARCHNAASHNALFRVSIPAVRPGRRLFDRAGAEAASRERERRTDGFSSEKFTEVLHGHVCRGSQACRIGTTAIPPPPPAEPNGSEILVRCLQEEGVKYLWGYPGGAVLYIYDALYKQDSIQHVLVRHEQAAVHAADGYARATGEVGVAWSRQRPRRHQRGHRHRHRLHGLDPDGDHHRPGADAAIGLDAFQECDTVGITRPIVKHNFLVKDVRDLA